MPVTAKSINALLRELDFEVLVSDERIYALRERPSESVSIDARESDIAGGWICMIRGRGWSISIVLESIAPLARIIDTHTLREDAA